MQIVQKTHSLEALLAYQPENIAFVLNFEFE